MRESFKNDGALVEWAGILGALPISKLLCPCFEGPPEALL